MEVMAVSAANSIFIPESIKSRLEVLSEERGVSSESVALFAIVRYLELQDLSTDGLETVDALEVSVCGS